MHVTFGFIPHFLFDLKLCNFCKHFGRLFIPSLGADSLSCVDVEGECFVRMLGLQDLGGLLQELGSCLRVAVLSVQHRSSLGIIHYPVKLVGVPEINF